MVVITSEKGYIKMDFTAVLDSADYSTIYILENKVISVKLTKDNSSIEFVCQDNIYEFDVNGVKGHNAIVDNKTSLTNIQLAERLAKLKGL